MREILGRVTRRSGKLVFCEPSDLESGPPPARFHHALAFAGSLEGRRVLDVGCWTGRLLSLCASAGAAGLAGVDLGGPWLEAAARLVPNAHLVPVPHLSALSAEAVEPADVVFFLETLEHVPRGSEIEALRSIARMVAPGGTLILSTPASGLAALLDPAWVLTGHRHYRRRTLRRLLDAAELRPVDFRYSGDLGESIDVAAFYATKHILKRPYATPRFFRRPDRDPTPRRRLDTTTIWVEAVAPAHRNNSERVTKPEATARLKRGSRSASPEGPLAPLGITAPGDGGARSRPHVAVVVPTRNSARTLAACLESLRAQTLPCSIVVVDNGSTDRTCEIASQLADAVVSGGPERAAQRNRGASLVRGASVLGFIDSDMVVGPRVVEEASRVLAEGPGAAIVPERSFGTGFWAQVRAFERSFYLGSDAVEAARFFRREVFEAVEGFDERLPPGPEDWDLTRRVRADWPIARIDAWIDHDEGEPTLVGLWRKKAYYAPGLHAYAKKCGGEAAANLDRPYLRRPWLIFTKGARLGSGLALLKVGEFVAVLAALTQHPARDRKGA